MIHDVSEDFDQLQSNVGSILRTMVGGFNELTLEYTDTEGATVTLLPGIDAVELLSHYSGRKFLCMEFGHVTPEDQYIASEFLTRYKALWKRRKPQLGWLDQMLKRTDYDPFENYDRKEDGGWSDTTDIGARSGTDNLTDTMASRSDSETITPTVKTKETVTPTLKTKETVTPTVKTKETETPGVTETTTETPRASRTTTETKGISETVAESFYGDNSSTMVPSKNVVTTPGNGQNVTTVAGVNGTDTTEVSRTGTNTKTTEVLSGDTQTVNEIVSGNTETVNEVVSGNTATSRTYGAHTDTHNRSTSSVAAQDVITRLFDEYRIHGNIGVSTVSDQIRKELDLRSSIDLAELFIREFVEKFTFFAE